jgi:glycosyltransferase involved in cell wall biosynthesis
MVAKSSFDEAHVVTAGRNASHIVAVAAATGLRPDDVLLTKSLSKRVPVSLAMPAFWKSASSIIRRNSMTVLHLLEFKSALTLYAIMLRTLFPRRTRLVHSAFGQLSTLGSPGLLVRTLCRLYASKVDLVLCQSETEGESVAKVLSRFSRRAIDLRILSLAVLDAPPVAEVARASDSSTLRTLFLGRVVPEKGVVEGLNFLETFMGPSTAVSHSILGPRQNESYERAIEAAVRRLPGTIVCRRAEVGEPSTRYAHYRDADIFVMLPTVKEETSLATIEALVTGCKVVIDTNCVIPHFASLPSLVLLYTDQTAQAIVEWMRGTVVASELALARSLFIERGRTELISALRAAS